MSRSPESAVFEETYENYRRFLNPPLARVMKLSGSPVEMRAEGCYIWDHQGKRYLDFAGGYGVFTLGHRHPRVIAAVKAQLDVMPLSAKTMFNPLMGRLARRLAEMTPGDLEISFFCNSGTEAVEGALKLARAATQRTRIIATFNAYHGKTLGALSVSGREVFRAPFGALLPDVVHVPFGDIDALGAAFESTTATADATHEVAAFIVEPVQAEGGVTLPPLGYLREAKALCKRYGAIFIADEIQTGLGRCGMRFACDRDGIVPDVMTLAKGLSGGVMPIGAYISSAAVWNAAYKQRPLVHTSTFGGNELACAAALEALLILEDEQVIENARLRGSELLEGARALADEFPDVVADARGLGLLVGVELRHEGYAGAIIPELLKQGVTAAWTLNQQSVIRLEPPLIVEREQIFFALEALRSAIAAAARRLGPL